MPDHGNDLTRRTFLETSLGAVAGSALASDGGVVGVTMQIMEGDVIRTIRDNIAHIAHFHTGGVPGRNEIDEKQELYYPQIVRAILETGFTGYLAQEFVPSRDPLTSLREGASICDV